MRLAIVFIFALLATPAAAGVCPDNQLTAGCWVDAVNIFTNAPTGTFGPSGEVPWTAGTPCDNACYDLPAGTLAARGVADTQGGCIGAARAQDVYEIVGPAGPPLAFEAVLQVHAELAAFTSYVASIDAGGESAECNVGPDCEAAIALSYAPGMPFLLMAEALAAGDKGSHPEGVARVTAQIRFRGLPAGYSIVSCQNYDLPTPAMPSSWGGVKALYR
jgi:hypothetical protein